jgi:hypothetical protein
METGRRPDRGGYAAVDVHYLGTGGARAAAVLAADAAFARRLAGHTAVVPRAAPCGGAAFSMPAFTSKATSDLVGMLRRNVNSAGRH